MRRPSPRSSTAKLQIASLEETSLESSRTYAKSARMFVGSYDFHLVRGDRWRIDRFKFNVKFVEPPR